LSLIRAGQRVRIHSLDDRESQAQRLRELGMLEGRTLRVVSNSDPLICQVGECRLGVCRRLAHCVLVEPLHGVALSA
jgi:Fe2+ transport system protein FeoA